MAPKESSPPSSLPGIWKYPTYRDHPLKSGSLWLKGRQEDDGAEGLWRVHDKLYDLNSFINKHPGGAEWLEMTKGTDITEAFEAHHISTGPEKLLQSYYERPARTPRNSPFTFHENGFYKTLKRRVREVLGKSYSGHSPKSAMIADVFVTGTIIFSILAAATGSYILGSVAGGFLCFLCIAAHNFFHQKDNFRMYYFDLSFMSSKEWRISHVLSHHLYPNTIHDLELSALEPILQWLPHKTKSFWTRYASWIYSFMFYAVLWFINGSMRYLIIAKGIAEKFSWRDAMPLIIPTLMYFVGGSSLKDTVIMWIWIIASGSFIFTGIGYNAGHHHPDIFRDGDAPREDLDWGIYQLDSVRDRDWISSNLWLVLMNFGNHPLHHLFPTVDHDHLFKLKPVFKKTCQEFGVDFRLRGIWEIIQGGFKILSKVEPNPLPPNEGNQ